MHFAAPSGVHAIDRGPGSRRRSVRFLHRQRRHSAAAANTATFYSINANATLGANARIATGGTGISVGSFAASRVIVAPHGAAACLYVADAKSDDIAGIDTVSKEATGLFHGGGQFHHLYASYTSSTTAATFQIQPAVRKSADGRKPPSQKCSYRIVPFDKNSCMIFVMRLVFGFLALAVLYVAFAAKASAAPPTLSTDAQHLCVLRAEGYLGASLGRWQKRLNLEDWKISVAMAPSHDLKPMTLGNIHWDAKQKTAVIHVLDASDYRVSCRDALEDMEMTLVHELVHLELSSLPRSTASRREEEFAVNRIADALVQLDRHPAGVPAPIITGASNASRPAADAAAPTW